MIRTLMDERYYYGIRQEAAHVLTKVPLFITPMLMLVCNRIIRMDRRTPPPPCIPKILLFPWINDTGRKRLQ